MNPHAPKPSGSVCPHLFQKFPTVGQQLAHPLSLRQGLSGVESMFPAPARDSARPSGLRGPVLFRQRGTSITMARAAGE
jgi:hypothetical protein